MNTSWLVKKNNTNKLGARPQDIQMDQNEPFFFTESFFHDMLIIERKRAERSKKPFMLLLLDIRNLTNRGISPAIRKKIRNVLNESTREIDIKGWYENGRVIGIIYTEITSEGKQPICKKLQKNLTKEFSESVAEKSTISCIFFPQKFDDKTDNQTIEQLYPELLDTTINTSAALAAKRVIDFIGSAVALMLFSPFFIIIPIVIKATSKGPIFFKQKRVGLGGKTFTFLKFRSMFVNNDPSMHMQFIKSLINGPGESNAAAQDAGGKTLVFKMVNDPRITKIGRFLRKTSLDELPQLINVLIGNMSLVGPRPAIPYEVREYAPWHLQRIFPIKPGITGVWQVEGRSHTSFENMVRMDIQYINSWSPLLDLKIIFKTPFSVLASKGAY